MHKKIKEANNKRYREKISACKNGHCLYGPDVISLSVSRECNFNCLSCWNHSLYIEKRNNTAKLDKKVVFKTLDEAAKMNSTNVLFSGAGEPFTHPNMMDFIKRADKNKFTIWIQTNLSLAKNIDELASSMATNIGHNIICVNMMAASCNTYKKIHPNQNGKVFEIIINKIKKLRQLGHHVRYVFVVNKLNYKEILDAVKLNKKLDSILHFEIMDYDPGTRVADIAITDKIKNTIIEEFSSLSEDSKKNTNIDVFIKQLKYSGLGVQKINKCFVGMLYSVIEESGNVYYCYDKCDDFYIGNLYKNSFSDLWNSKKYRMLRKRMASGKFLDNCNTCIAKRGYNFKIRQFIKGKV